MLERFTKKETPLDIELTRLYEEMNTYGPTDPEYNIAFTYMERLTKIKKESHREKVKSDTVWMVIGNIVVVLIVVGYERNHVMITRAKDFFVRSNI